MEIQEQLNRLTGIVDALASSVVAHDHQIENLILLDENRKEHLASHDERIANLITLAEKSKEEMAEIRRSQVESVRLFEAYLRRLPPQ
jgi:hypothetical protein